MQTNFIISLFKGNVQIRRDMLKTFASDLNNSRWQGLSRNERKRERERERERESERVSECEKTDRERQRDRGRQQTDGQSLDL